ncbi:LLM class flavin-dependent oxidoreductase [Sciscionella marina]|uniref:LLM class flavin-dependent oxidoreductase n=1 Tax=Sciscionella marina TaxID=508770 RepID=UPI00035E2F43|nr:LLM class flavin-dependent oxidoreductase [Sciscionella marina]
MRYSINIPNFGDFADARAVTQVAVAAEEAGWDAVFVWDHVLFDKRLGYPIADPWLLLGAIAQATNRVRLGAMVTPVARRRPQQLARQVSTLDNMSEGRVVFGAGLGAPIEDEYGSFGEPTDPVLLAERLDEGLGLLGRYWTGEPVDHEGKHYTARDVALLPPPVQRPRVPVWIAGNWPRRGPMRRALRWDGMIPFFPGADHGTAPAPEQVRELTAFAHARTASGPFDIVVGGVSPADPGAAAELVGPLAEAGANWWDERRPIDADIIRLDPVLRRVQAGPPRF